MSNENETASLEAFYEAAYELGRSGRVIDSFHDLCIASGANDQEIARAAFCFYKGWQWFDASTS